MNRFSDVPSQSPETGSPTTTADKDVERIRIETQRHHEWLLSWRKHRSETASVYLSRIGNRALFRDNNGQNASTLDTILNKTLLPLSMVAYKTGLKVSAIKARSLNNRYQYCCCTDVDRFASRFKADILANMTLSELQDSARRGCTRCCLISECVMRYADEWSHVPPREIIVTGDRDLVEGAGSVAVLTVFWVEPEMREQYSGPPKWSKFELEIYSDEGDHVLYPGMTPRPRLLISVDADQAANIILGWMEDCISQHEPCSRSRPERFIPTRLLDVGAKGDVSRLRLVHRDDIVDQDITFAALSYCWGRPQDRVKPIPMTRKATSRDWLQDIPWDDLTPVFQDTVALARCLHVRYLWIDALCIIQDDEQDFAREASQMASIYGEAYLVIAATRAQTGDAGLFHSRQKAQVVSHQTEDGKTASVLTRKPIEHDDFTTGEPRHFTSSPLFARAWCFQERLLARRVVHFAEHELLFECRERLQCECGNIGTADFGLYQNFKVASASGLEKRTAKSRYQTWYSTLRPYTARSLTFEKDRLPALSGFANLVSTPEMGKYCAGIWYGELPQGLLWRVIRPLPEKNGIIDRPTPYRAPTWSWAGVQAVVEGHIQFHDGRETVATVADVQCVLASSDLFGEVTSAHLVLEAPMVQVTIRAQSHTNANDRMYVVSRCDGSTDEIPLEADLGIFSCSGVCVAIAHDVKGTRRHCWSCLVLQKHELQNHQYRIGVVECASHWFNGKEWQTITIL